MHRILRRLPSLDTLKGFEAAGRRLSFTRAAEELFLTQSALSRQVQALEEALGVRLFERRHRSLSLTSAGATFHRAVVDALRALAAAAEATVARPTAPRIMLSTTVSFASLWLIPRLPSFRARHPDVEVLVSVDNRLLDLARGEVDVAVRFMADGAAPRDAIPLFGERMLPVVSPRLTRQKGAPLRTPADLARHVLLHYDEPEGRMPWLDWRIWLAANGLPELKPAGALRFSQYDLLIQAAIGGQGVALGRVPLVDSMLRDGRLVAPFPKRFDTPRSYFALRAPHTAGRADVEALIAWLAGEAHGTEVGEREPAPRRVRAATRSPPRRARR